MAKALKRSTSPELVSRMRLSLIQGNNRCFQSERKGIFPELASDPGLSSVRQTHYTVDLCYNLGLYNAIFGHNVMTLWLALRLN